MKRLLLFNFFILLLSQLYSQPDSALIQKLNKPIKNCEIIATNAWELISSYNFRQTDSIDNVLTVWEDHCGNVEPVQRIKILIAIYSESFIDSAFGDYVKNYIDKYKDRIDASKEPKYYEIFENYKPYFDYVPLNSQFDRWTKDFANQLLRYQNHGSSEYLLCLLLSDSVEIFDSELKKSIYGDNYVKTNYQKSKTYLSGSGFNFIFQAGSWFPLGRLALKFSPSPQIGLGLGLFSYKSVKLEAMLSLAFLINDKNFDINVENSIHSVNASSCATIGLLISKEFKVYNSLYFDVVGGIGYGAITTDLKKPNSGTSSNGTNTDSYYSVETVDLTGGFNIYRKVAKNASFGLNGNFHYVPYRIDRKLVKDFGSQFSSISLFYRF